MAQEAKATREAEAVARELEATKVRVLDTIVVVVIVYARTINQLLIH